jgi:basic membrane protein A
VTEPPPDATPPQRDQRPDDAAGSAIRTFLIADVRGYTRFTQERGDEAAAKLAAKFADTARKGVEARGGVVIELRGDEALAVFTSARQAIRAALYLQELFLEESMADSSLPLLVGIGLDAGEAVSVEAGYRGGALNLAARLCAIARPGEVLATTEVTHLARKTEGIRYEDRGHVQVKGITEPVVVIRVVSEESDAAARLAELAPKDEASPSGAPPWWRRSRIRVALIGVAALALAELAFAGAMQLRSGNPLAAVAAPKIGCELYAGDLNDRSWNQANYDGLSRAATEYGTTVRASRSDTEAANVQGFANFVHAHCDLIVSGQFAINSMVASARANPSQRYLMVDPFEDPSLPNILGCSFEVSQSAFLAGYLSAGMSRTQTIATFGGVPIPTVLPYMDGFSAGVLKYNMDHKAQVRLLGWDPGSGTGTFISQSDFSAFANRDRARAITQDFLKQGADIVFPVAGDAGFGAAEAVKAAKSALLVGVDFDAFYQFPEFSDLWLTSVRKRYDVAVAAVMGLVVNGKFSGGTSFRGTLANGSVDLAPFHDLDSRVPATLKADLDRISAGIRSGDVSVDPHDYLPS